MLGSAEYYVCCAATYVLFELTWAFFLLLHLVTLTIQFMNHPQS